MVTAYLPQIYLTPSPATLRLAPAFPSNPNSFIHEGQRQLLASAANLDFAVEKDRAQAHGRVLRKQLRFPDLVLAQIVIVLVPDFFGTAAKAGSSHVVFWILGIAFFFVPLTLVVAHLNRVMPLEGGLYEWSRLAFNDQIGFLTAWNVWLFNAVYSAGIGLLTVTFVSYAAGPETAWIAANKWIVFAACTVLIGTLMLLAHLGLGVAKWVSNVGCALTAFAVLALVAMPVFNQLRGARLDYHPWLLSRPTFNLSNLSVFAKMIFGALTAFEFVAIFAGECHDPGRNIARATFVAAPIIAFFYIFGTASILAYTSPDAVDLIAPIPQALSKGFRAIPVLSLLAPLSIVFLLTNYFATYCLQFSANGRLPMVAGWDHLLPKWFTRLHPRFRTPVNSILFLGVVTLVTGTAALLGVGPQEAFQLLVNWAFTFYGFAYLAMFLIPLLAPKDRGIRPAVGVRFAAASGLLFTLLFVVLSVFPVIDVASRNAYAIKMATVILGANALGLFIYRVGGSRDSERPA